MNKPTICSHRAAAALLGQAPKQYDVILIVSPVSPGLRSDDPAHLAAIRRNANRLCELAFDDVEFPREGYVMPAESHIREALAFATDKDDLVVTCTAGMGRSAALAYVVACSRMEPSEAVTILDPERHVPNEVVIGLGGRAVDAPDLLEFYARFKDCQR
jgi:predicted protein tyrosine phosphatase